MLGVGLAGAGTRKNGFQAHFSHQPLHAFAVDLVSQLFQPRRHSSGPKEGPLCVLSIDQMHQEQVLRGLACRLVVETGPGQAKQLALSAQADVRVGRVDQPALGLNGLRQLFFSQSPVQPSTDRFLHRVVLAAPRRLALLWPAHRRR